MTLFSEVVDKKEYTNLAKSKGTDLFQVATERGANPWAPAHELAFQKSTFSPLATAFGAGDI